MFKFEELAGLLPASDHLGTSVVVKCKWRNKRSDCECD